MAKNCRDSLARTPGVSGTYNSANTSYTSGLSYEPDGQMSAQALGNGSSGSIAYNQRLRPTSFSLAGTSGTVLALRFTYTRRGPDE